MRNSKNIKIFLFMFVFCVFSFFPLFSGSLVFAADEDATEKGDVQLSDPLGLDEEGAYEEGDAPQIFIGRIVDTSLGVVGSLALLMFVYGGFMWMLAAGNSERVEKGKNILFWATVGLVVIFTSYVIVHFVIFEVINAPGGGGGNNASMFISRFLKV